jgi:hypothetical protein
MGWGTNRDLAFATLVEQRLSRKTRAVIFAASDINASRPATRDETFASCRKNAPAVADQSPGNSAFRAVLDPTDVPLHRAHGLRQLNEGLSDQFELLIGRLVLAECCFREGLSR